MTDIGALILSFAGLTVAWLIADEMGWLGAMNRHLGRIPLMPECWQWTVRMVNRMLHRT